MRIVLQRVSRASLSVEKQIVSEIGHGLVLLIGIGLHDTPEVIECYAKKCVGLRIFPDENGKMNRSVKDTGGSILAVSQFTLYADLTRGNRPGFSDAAPPEKALSLYNYFVECLRKEEITVQTGIFGAMMEVEIHNSGPVTLILAENLWKEKR